MVQRETHQAYSIRSKHYCKILVWLCLAFAIFACTMLWLLETSSVGDVVLYIAVSLLPLVVSLMAYEQPTFSGFLLVVFGTAGIVCLAVTFAGGAGPITGLFGALLVIQGTLGLVLLTPRDALTSYRLDAKHIALLRSKAKACKNADQQKSKTSRSVKRNKLRRKSLKARFTTNFRNPRFRG